LIQGLLGIAAIGSVWFALLNTNKEK
jgi:hypothetical protein